MVITYPHPEPVWKQFSQPSINAFEEMVVDNFELIDLPLVHRFPEGMYVREIFMPKGSIVTSRVHKYESPFFITQGDVSVFTEGEEGIARYVAPFTGITKPGTRRVLYMHEDTVWITVHLNPENETDPEKLVQTLTIPHENPALVGKVKLHLGKQCEPLELEEGIV